jgi:predicted nucleotidyltransferase
MKKVHIPLPRRKIATFCQRWKVREFSLFGSVLRDGFRPDSDIDVIVDFEIGVVHTLFDLAAMAEELETIFGRHVDLMTLSSVRQSRNYLRRKEILSTREPVYVTG